MAESAPVRSNRAFTRFVFTAALSMFAFGLATGSVASALVFLEDASSAAALTTSAKARLVAATPLGGAGAPRAPRRHAGGAPASRRSVRAGGALCCRADRPEPPGVSALGRALLGVGAGVARA